MRLLDLVDTWNTHVGRIVAVGAGGVFFGGGVHGMNDFEHMMR